MSISKRNILNVILVFAIAIFTFIIGEVNVNAAFPSKLSALQEGDWVGSDDVGYIHIKYTNGNYYAICTSGTGIDASIGKECHIKTTDQWDEGKQAGVGAILNELNKGNLNGTNGEYWYAEVAIDSYLKPGSFGEKEEADSKVKDLVNIAKKAENKANSNFSVILSADSLSFSQSGDYYVSNTIKVSDKDNISESFDVSLSGMDSAEIINKTNDSFQVRIPTSKVARGTSVNVTAKVVLTTSYFIAKNYECGSEYQDMTTNYIEKKTVIVNKNISGKVTKTETSVKISKQDITNKEELAGATLIVKDANGNEIDKWVSTNKPHYIRNLEPGKYTLSETIAPEGYKLTTETISFEIKEDGKTTNVVMYNEPKTTGARISKQDITNKQELPGATLVIKDAKGNEIEKWVSTTEPHFVELKPGKYTLSETIAPVGYKLSTTTVEFEVKKDGTITPVVMYNEPSKGVVKISKQDITTKEELPGATLVVKDANGNEVDRWVSTIEPHYVELAPGEYILTEITAPNGYDLSYEVVRFTVNEDGTTAGDVIMYNSKTPNTSDRNMIFVIIGFIGTGLASVFAIKKLKKQI